jgi:hypothetical protein
MNTLETLFKETQATYVVAKKINDISIDKAVGLPKDTEVTVFRCPEGTFVASGTIRGHKFFRLEILDTKSWELIAFGDADE